MKMVLAGTLTLQVRGCVLAALMQERVELVLMVTNWEGSVMMMTVLGGTGWMEKLNLRLTGSYCRLMVKL